LPCSPPQRNTNLLWSQRHTKETKNRHEDTSKESTNSLSASKAETNQSLESQSLKKKKSSTLHHSEEDSQEEQQPGADHLLVHHWLTCHRCCLASQTLLVAPSPEESAT
jgi:Flp pilus assembly protein TadB